MASDFGDESGQRLLDDFTRFGERAGIEAMRDRAHAFRRACDHARAGALAEAGQGDIPGAEPREWARLDMGEFERLEGYDGIKPAIESKMRQRGVDFRWARAEVDGREREFLIFRTVDARQVWEGFGDLSRDSDLACERAAEAVRAAVAAKEGRVRGDAAERGPKEGKAASAGERRVGWASEALAEGGPAGPGGRAAEPAGKGAPRGAGRAKALAERLKAPGPRDGRPLEERAANARAVSSALEGARATSRDRAREPRMQEVRSK